MHPQYLATTTRLLRRAGHPNGQVIHYSRVYSTAVKETWNAFSFQPDRQAATRTSTSGGPLNGKSVAVKDNICTLDMPTICSSKILQDFQPPYDATCVRLLRDAGATIAGKTNCDEFGMGSLNLYSAHGPVVNPLSQEGEPRSAGGSSGGSAAAVAARLCFAALGTDTGGSIRLPAAYCGVVGLKPSYGMISRWGVVSYADSLDCVGVLASTVDDAKLILDTISRYDPRDPTSVPEDIRISAQTAAQSRIDLLNQSPESLDGIRIGVPQEYFPLELDQSSLTSFRTLVSDLQQRGAMVAPVSLPSTSYALSAYYVLASAEASSNLSRYDGIRYGKRMDVPKGTDLKYAGNAYAATRTAGFGREVKKRILLGTYALSADAFENYFLQAQRIRALVRDDFNKVFSSRAPSLLQPASSSIEQDQGVDVLLHPSAIRTAPPLFNDKSNSIDAYVQDVLTVPASLAGLPALSVPCGKGSDGWPVGASVVGQWGYDSVVCRVGWAIEACMNK